MRDLKINQQTVYYSLCVPNSVEDENGNLADSYTEPVKGRFNVSPAKGEASMQPFGRNVDYDCEMTTHNKDIEINEFSRLWIGVETDKSYNFIVKKVAKSINCIRYAIKQVNVS